MMNWYQTQTHLHASFEQYSSVRSHAAQAQRLGYDILFITEHDVRMNYMKGCIKEFHITGEGDALLKNGAGWYHDDKSPCKAVLGKCGYMLTLESGETASFCSNGKKHQAALVAELTIKIHLDISDNKDFRIAIILSQHPDTLKQQRLCYEYGNCGNNDESDWRLKLEIDNDGWAVLPISEDVLKFDMLGQDNAFCSLSLECFGNGSLGCYGFTIGRIYTAEDCRLRQQKLADEIGLIYGMKIYAANEVSIGSGHRNSYSEHIQVIDYEKRGFSVPISQCSAEITADGGTLCYNHMFDLWKRGSHPNLEHDELISLMADILTENRCEGAHLIEVGYPLGRSGFSISDHMKVWDLLALRGIRITGVGDSDCHDSRSGWLDGNNFCTWFRAESADRKSIESAMRTGRACFGDPARWNFKKHNMRFRLVNSSSASYSYEIGDSVSVSKVDTAVISLSELNEKIHLKLMIGGIAVNETDIDSKEIDLSIPISIEESDAILLPVRFELYGFDGRCIFCTNPIYLDNNQL